MNLKIGIKLTIVQFDNLLEIDKLDLSLFEYPLII